MKPALLIVAAIALAACGHDHPPQTAPPSLVAQAAEPQAPRECPASAGDSARAVCLAGAPPRQVFEVVRRGDTVCVTTGPGAGPNGVVTTDDMARTSVVRGVVVGDVHSDSIGCR